MLSVENANAEFLTGCRRAMTCPFQFQSLENYYSMYLVTAQPWL
jgi:hypothetical protein